MSGEPSEQDLLHAVKESLAQDGRLGRFKAELRSAVMSILNRDPSNASGSTTQIPDETHMINELIREYLVWNGYLYAEQILVAESGESSEKPNRESIAAKLGVLDDAKTTLPSRYIPVMRNKPTKSSGYGPPPKRTAGGSKPGRSETGKGGAHENRPDSGKSGAASAAPVSEKTPGRMMMEHKDEYELPAISVLIQKKPDLGAEWQEKRKKKMIRRNVPPGENTNKLKEIVKSLKDQEINVHEFVGLVAPSTGDQALSMRNILAEEMTTFRKMCRRVYDTMTQDVSDVLANEQVQLTDDGNHRIAMYNDKMMRSIDEIFAYIPDFDFELYYQDDDYLRKKFPLCPAEVVNADDEKALLRQEAFHRYQWLRSEGDRLAAENTRLQDRLNYLKQQQKEEVQRTQEVQTQNEETREKLEATEDALQEEVEELNKSIEKMMVENEVMVMKSMKKSASKKRTNLKELNELKQKKLEARPEWNVGAAQEVEEKTTEEVTQGQISQVSMSTPVAATSSTGAIKKQLKRPKGDKKKSKFQRPPPLPQEADAFHYSPPKTPPGYDMPPNQTSPFHYSPIRSPSASRGGSPMGGLPGQPPRPPRMVRMETSTTVMEPTRIPTGPRYSHHHSANLW